MFQSIHFSILSQLIYSCQNLIVTIHDNGKGIDTENLRRFGNGLHNMRQRMESVGGSIKITSDKGTCVQVECPVGG